MADHRASKTECYMRVNYLKMCETAIGRFNTCFSGLKILVCTSKHRGNIMNAAAAKPDTKGHWTVCVIQPLDYNLFKRLWKILLLCYTALIATVLDEVMLIGTMLLVSTKLQRFMIAKHFIDFFTDLDIEKWKELVNQSSENACDLYEKEAWQDLGLVI